MRIQAIISILPIAALLGGCAVIDPEGLKSHARGDLRALFSSADYPSAALRRGEEGNVRARLTVGVDGKVTQCEIESSSGSELLDAATCRVLTERARFDPARNHRGEPVIDVITTTLIRWYMSDGASETIEGEVINLNEGFRLYIDYGRAGRVNACKLTPLHRDLKAPCGPYLQAAHEIYAASSRRINEIERGVMPFERGTVREQDEERQRAAFEGIGELIDREIYRFTIGTDGEVTECEVDVKAAFLFAYPRWVCDELEYGHMTLPCPASENRCAGVWTHYRYLGRLMNEDHVFDDTMRFAPILSEVRG